MASTSTAATMIRRGRLTPRRPSTKSLFRSGWRIGKFLHDLTPQEVAVDDAVDGGFVDAALDRCFRPDLNHGRQASWSKPTGLGGHRTVAGRARRESILLVAQVAPDAARADRMARTAHAHQDAPLMCRHERTLGAGGLCRLEGL